MSKRIFFYFSRDKHSYQGERMSFYRVSYSETANGTILNVIQNGLGGLNK